MDPKSRTNLSDLTNADYSTGITSNAFHQPNIDMILERVCTHASWHGLRDIFDIDQRKDSLLRSLKTLIHDEIKLINECTSNVNLPSSKSGKESLIKNRKKLLVKREEELLRKFSKDIPANLDYWESAKLKGILFTIGQASIIELKLDLCNNKSSTISGLCDIVNTAFTASDENISQLFDVLKTMPATLYYIAGWHNQACKKAGERRKNKEIGRAISLFAKNGLSTLDNAKMQKLPVDKVQRLQLFGGLSFPNEKYFLFIQRIEYIFVKSLTPAKLLIRQASDSLLCLHLLLKGLPILKHSSQMIFLEPFSTKVLHAGAQNR
ncbi:predicted protein [Chaetoceros tenuissimus]|uniref:Uncharacterized protein n=1 Tax=Chaetoceros tenuissimus TaxID=426638 RepID=A0AAD3D0V2_9STRA|nr:predicted protein [Chaetoceros tenuissimus]